MNFIQNDLCYIDNKIKKIVVYEHKASFFFFKEMKVFNLKWNALLFNRPDFRM